MNYEIKITGSGTKGQILASLRDIERYLSRYEGVPNEDSINELPTGDNVFEDPVLIVEIS